MKYVYVVMAADRPHSATFDEDEADQKVRELAEEQVAAGVWRYRHVYHCKIPLLVEPDPKETWHQRNERK